MSVLDTIIVGVREDLSVRMSSRSLSDVKAACADAPAPLDPLPAFVSPGLSVIAEVKRRSPSKGHLAGIVDPARLALAYADGGAAAISVLTEQRRFAGSLSDLEQVRAAVPTPVLRKDFIVEDYQIYEARAAGADLVLLIVAALDQSRLTELHGLIEALEMTALVEVHNDAEAERAVALGARVVGVNNRNLLTLDVDNSRFAAVAAHLPVGTIKVAESGISGPRDAALMYQAGADVVLVGEALVKHEDPTAAIAELAAAGQPAEVSDPRSPV